MNKYSCQKVMQKVKHNKRVFLCGDMKNANNMTDNNATHYEDITFSLGLYQFIDETTRI